MRKNVRATKEETVESASFWQIATDWSLETAGRGDLVVRYSQLPLLKLELRPFTYSLITVTYLVGFEDRVA
jgi:hypothetical protein